jgi:hypothetical protein
MTEGTPMISRRSIINLIALMALLAGGVWSHTWFGDGLRYLAFAYFSIDIVLRARAGYLRRRPYWTADSWRRYLLACAVPVVALLIVVCMMAAFEWRLPIVGAARSTARGVWAAVTLVFMFIGAVGLVTVIDWLARGDPSQPFVSPRPRYFATSRRP